VQILHPFSGSLKQYDAAIADPDRYRPDHRPPCEARRPLCAHGFYRRALVEVKGTTRLGTALRPGGFVPLLG
jgi:hypothetical protein